MGKSNLSIEKKTTPAEAKKSKEELRESNKSMRTELGKSDRRFGEEFDAPDASHRKLEAENKRLEKHMQAHRQQEKDIAALAALSAKRRAKERRVRDDEWRKENPTRSERTGISPAELLRIDRKARLKAKEEATRRKKRGLPQLKRPGPLKPGEAEA